MFTNTNKSEGVLKFHTHSKCCRSISCCPLKHHLVMAPKSSSTCMPKNTRPLAPPSFPISLDLSLSKTVWDKYNFKLIETLYFLPVLMLTGRIVAAVIVLYMFIVIQWNLSNLTLTSKGPEKYVRLYRMSGYCGFILVNRNTYNFLSDVTGCWKMFFLNIWYFQTQLLVH